MYKMTIPEVLDELGKITSYSERVGFLRTNSTNSLKEVLRYIFDENIVFPLDDLPPYKKNDQPEGLADNNLFQEAGRLYIFAQPTIDKMGMLRTEQNLIPLLESVSAPEAELIGEIITNKVKKKNLTKKLVTESFPGLIP